MAFQQQSEERWRYLDDKRCRLRRSMQHLHEVYRQCHKSVIVLGSNRFKTDQNQAEHLSRKRLTRQI